LWAIIENALPWANMVDVIDVLFNGTELMSFPRNETWKVTCCSTFFVRTDLLWRRPREDYVRLLRNIQYLTTAGLCNIFPYWYGCDVGQEAQMRTRNPAFTDDFIIGLTLEKLWGVILANRTHHGYLDRHTVRERLGLPPINETEEEYQTEE
jgi:hypothetical protein